MARCGEGPKQHIHQYLFIPPQPISFSLFVIFELRFLNQINLSCILSLTFLCCLSFFLSTSLIFVAFFHQCTYQFLSPEGFDGFLCAISSQSDPSSDKYSFQRPLTGNESISGFSSHSLLPGNLTCQKNE